MQATCVIFVTSLIAMFVAGFKLSFVATGVLDRGIHLITLKIAMGGVP